VSGNIRTIRWKVLQKKYNVHLLVYFELLEDMQSAIVREKQLKKWNRAWKLALIEKQNPTWQDLWFTIL